MLRLALEWRAPWEYGVSLVLRPLLEQGASAATGTRCCCSPASWPRTAPRLRCAASSRSRATSPTAGSSARTRGRAMACWTPAARTRRRSTSATAARCRSSAGAWAASTRASSPRSRPGAVRAGGHARHAVHRAPQGHQRVAPLREGHRPQDRRGGPPRAAAHAAAGAHDVDLQPHGRHRRVAVQHREAGPASTRTSRSRRATWAWGSTRSRGTRSRTASRSAKAGGSPSTATARARWLYRDPKRAGWF